MNNFYMNDFLSEQEMKFIENDVRDLPWSFIGHSNEEDHELRPTFWFKDIINTKSCWIFKKEIEKKLQKKIIINYAYVNGQAHSQSGYWHRDTDINDDKHITLVYFLSEWPPEYGGHLLIQYHNNILSFLPKRNSGIMFNSYFLHMGLEPSCYCKTQRESFAIKFKIEE